MTKWILGVLALALAIFPAHAAAGSTIATPGGAQFPYQQWIDSARVPTPEITIEIWETATDECGGGATACAVPGRYYEDGLSRIFFWTHYFPTEPTRPIFYHEVGHLFDVEELNNAQRGRYRRLAGSSGTWAVNDESAPRERFAESYRRCATGLPESRAVCALIRRAAQ